MKNLIIGIAVGVIVGIGGTLLIYQPGEEPVRGLEMVTVTEQARGRSGSIQGDDHLLPRATNTTAIMTSPEKTGALVDSSEIQRKVSETGAPITPGESRESATVIDDRITELLALWPEIYLSGDTSRINALLDELKEAGKTNTDRMIAIFRESGSLTNRLTAARTLGAINRDLMNPELSEIIKREVFPFLEKTYREEASIDLRESCLYAMGEVRTGKSMRFLEEMTENENRNLARAAVYSLGIDGGDEAVEKLAAYWSDPEGGRLRWTAAAGLGENGNRRTMDQLRDIYYDNDNDEERIMAAYTLGRLNSKLNDESCDNLLGSDVLSFLNDVISGNGDPQTRRRAVWALGESGLMESDQAIFRILESDESADMDLKSTAVRVLGSSGDSEAAGECLNLFRYGDEDIDRVRAVQVLGQMNNRDLENVTDSIIRDEAIPFLLSTWDEHPSRSIKKEIITSLGLTGGEEEIEFLENISSSNQDLSRNIRRATRRIEHRLETGEDWAVSYRRRRR